VFVLVLEQGYFRGHALFVYIPEGASPLYPLYPPFKGALTGCWPSPSVAPGERIKTASFVVEKYVCGNALRRATPLPTLCLAFLSRYQRRDVPCVAPRGWQQCGGTAGAGIRRRTRGSLPRDTGSSFFVADLAILAEWATKDRINKSYPLNFRSITRRNI